MHKKKKMRRRLGIVLILVSIASLSYSKSNIKDSVQLEEVVVTGSKTEISRKIVPITVSRISRKNIVNSGQLNILTSLNTYVPGVFVTERNILGFGVSTGGSGAISIRGVGGNPNTGVLVLIDGHPQYQGIFGHPLSDSYVASDVEAVEIIRGPGSILYGTNAMAGVINIITRKNGKEGLSGDIGASYGAYNTFKYYETIGFKKNKFSSFASFNHGQTDGIRENTDFNINNGYVKIGYELSDHFNISGDFNLAKYKANDNGTIYDPKPFNINVTRGKTAISLINRFKNSDGSLKVYHNFGTHDLSDGWHSTDRNTGMMLYQTFRLLPGNSLTVGSDFKQYGGLANKGMAANLLKTVNELALYTYVQQNLLHKLTLSAGLRLENNSVYGNELVPLAGLNYNPTRNTTFKSSISKGFRSPTIMELYLFAPNADLKPERLVNYEISWLQSMLDSQMDFELTAYLSKGENMIQVAGQYPNISRQNVGSFTNQGVEASVKYMVNDKLFVNANYSFLDLSTPIIAAPRQQINLSVNYSYKIWNLNGSVQHIEKLYTSTSPLVSISYTLVNARISVKPIKRLEIFVAGNNLLNQKYEITYGYPLAGINASVGFNYGY